MRCFASRPNRGARRRFDSSPGHVNTKLRFAPYPTDLRPAQVITDDTIDDYAGAAADCELEELDSYEQEERELLFAAWVAELDAGQPPF